MDWERSPDYDRFQGCRFCVHWRAARCAAYPERIPIVILSGEVDHLVPRPGQVGDTVFEPIDIDEWYRTRRRVPLSTAPSAAARST
jgi:hypothetical protein